MKTDWICTDPDTEQYGRQISERVFEFKEKNPMAEFDKDENEFIEFDVNLDDYTAQEIENHINTYGYTLFEPKGHTFTSTNIFEQYGEEANWIIAECIFEQESGNY